MVNDEDILFITFPALTDVNAAGASGTTLITGTLLGLDKSASYRIDVATRGDVVSGCAAAGPVYSVSGPPFKLAIEEYQNFASTIWFTQKEFE